ncbi:hypothetical protein [Carnobacterium jeotgali]|uniref:hypothetical protein n=1 Tax=Carnobacterium jeotgali TaxID=545534 RepID=UPI0038906850
MLLSILFLIFSLLLIYAAYFFYTGKAMVLLTSTGKETTPEIAAFFKFYGALFFIGGLGSLVLVFYQLTLLAFAVLLFVMLTMLCFIFGLNKRM